MEMFKIGGTYYTRSICDHNCIYTVEVLKRTAKTITAKVDGREVKTLRISINHRCTAEMVRPHGTYSMAAIVDATDDRPLARDWERPVVAA